MSLSIPKNIHFTTEYVPSLIEMPNDLLVKIFVDLTRPDFLNVELVCKRFRNVFTISQFWQAMSPKFGIQFKSKQDFLTFSLRRERIIQMIQKEYYTFNKNQITNIGRFCSGFLIMNRSKIFNVFSDDPLICFKEDSEICCLKKNTPYLFIGSKNGTIQVWHLPSQECRATFQSNQGEISCFKQGEYKDTFFSGTVNGAISRWNLITKEGLHQDSAHKDVVTALIEEQKILYSASLDKEIKIWNFKDKLQCLFTLKGHSKGVRRLLKNGHSLLSASYDGTIKEWDLKQHTCVRTLEHSESDSLYHLRLDPLNQFLFSGTQNSTTIWDLITSQIIYFSTHKSQAVFLKRKNEYLYIGLADGSMITLHFSAFPYPQMLKITELIQNNKTQTRGMLQFLSFRPSFQNEVYKHFYRIEKFNEKETLESAKLSFLFHQDARKSSIEKRVQAIYCFVLKEIILQLKNGSTSHAMTIFKQLPKKIQKKIPKPLSKESTPIEKAHWIQKIGSYLQKSYQKPSLEISELLSEK